MPVVPRLSLASMFARPSAAVAALTFFLAVPGCQNFGNGVLLTVNAAKGTEAEALRIGVNGMQPQNIEKPDGSGFFCQQQQRSLFFTGRRA